MKPIYDHDDDDFCIKLSGNMLMDSDGDLMLNMGNNLAMDLDSGELHIMSGCDDNDLFNNDDNDD